MTAGLPFTAKFSLQSLINPVSSFSSSHISSNRKGVGPHLSHSVSSISGQLADLGLGEQIDKLLETGLANPQHKNLVDARERKEEIGD